MDFKVQKEAADADLATTMALNARFDLMLKLEAAGMDLYRDGNGNLTILRLSLLSQDSKLDGALQEETHP